MVWVISALPLPSTPLTAQVISIVWASVVLISCPPGSRAVVNDFWSIV
jgi:hypothetical protein